MAVLGRVLFSSAERVDLVDLLGIDSYTIGDFKFLLKSLVGDDKPFILKGFEVLDPAGAIGSANISVQVADSVAYFPGSSAGPFFFGLPEGNTLSQPLVPELRKNATNFVYLTLSTSDTAKDSRALFDPDANGGDGAEFVQDINTESVLIAEINVSVSSFPANTIPVCKVVVGATSIISIQDCRDLLFRLGSGGLSPDPLSRFSFRSEPSSTYTRTETPTTINSVGQPNPFRGADKNIRTWKEWMDVVMTKLAELGGTTYWYQNSNSISNITLFKDALATAVKSKGNWQHDLNTEGLLTWTEDIHLKNALSQFDVIIRAGNKTLPNENVMYISLVRDAAPNDANIQLTWVNGLNYVDGVAGSFINLAKGDWIKKVDDPDQYMLRVEEFYASPALGGGATSAALAQSIRLSSTYSGTSSISLGSYTKGVYQTSDVLFLPRSSTSLTTNGNMHWLAMRSDVVMNCSNVNSLVVSGTVSDGNGTVAKFTATSHGLVDGDRITIAGSVNYNGTYEVEVEDANTFYIKTTGTVTEPGVNAYYSLVTTTTRSTAYGLQLESSNHGFKSGDTVKITDTTSYNGTYFINVRTSSSFTFPIPSAPANETSGTATLVSMLIRDTNGYNELVRGEVISISDGSVVLDGWLGRGSVAEVNPNWQISGSYNALDGMESYNASDTDNMTQRVSKLTAMMADKAQDKTVKWLTPSTVEYINKATNGANQDITFTGLPSILVTSPGSPGGTTLSLSGTLALPANSAAYFTLGRNSATSVASLNALTVSTIAALPISENIFIFAVRGSGTDVWLWDGTPLYEVANYYNIGKQALRDLREDRSAYLRSDSPVTWSGSQLTFTTDIILEILNTKTGTISTHTVLLANSPISLTSGQIAYITINRDNTSENLTPTIVSSLPAQTLLNKDIIVLFRRVDVSGNGYLHIPLHKQVIEPGQTVRLGASGSGSGTSGINYISANPGFESNTNGWERYADAAGAVPVDGTGGAPNVNFTLTRSVSDPLRGVASGLITKDAANRQGHGVSFDFTIDRADEAKPQSVEFDYEVSANFVAGSDSTISDVVAYMYDLDYGQVIQLTPYKIVGGFGSKHKFLATFQTSAASGGADSRKFRLILHVATTNALAWTFKFDNVRVGPQLVNYGSPVTDWDGHGWTPTGSFVTNTTYNPGKWRRVGDSMELFASLSFTGAPNAGPFTINLPPGYTLDTAKLASTGNANSPLGIAIAGDTGAGGYHGVVGANNSTSLLVGATNPGPSVNWSDVFPFTFGNTDTISIFALVPIVGWSSTVEMSNDTDTRVAAARASTAATTIDNTTPTVINGTEDYDTHSAYNPANGRYTAQVAGYYRIDTSIRFNSQTYAPGDILELSLFKNGVLYSILDRFVVETVLTDIIMLDGNDVVKLVAGDYLEVRAYNDVSTALDGSASGNHTAFTKYSGPSQVAASEKVAAIFETDTASAMNNSSDTIVDFEDLVYDSHNAVTTGATWKFTAPSAGVYKISAMTHSDGGGPWTAGESWDMKLFKNGVFVRSLGTELMQANHTERANISGSANIYLNAGDYIDIRVNQNSGAASLNLSGDPGYNHVSIEKS